MSDKDLPKFECRHCGKKVIHRFLDQSLLKRSDRSHLANYNIREMLYWKLTNSFLE